MGDPALDETGEGLSTRQRQILSAAEACFVNAGFHRTTMQDIAKAAAMSPPNIYRYFDSKQAIVIAIGERERAFAAGFMADLDAELDPCAALMEVLSRYSLNLSRLSAVMRLEIWAEATRNPAIAETMHLLEAQRRTWIVERLKSPGRDPHALYEAIDSLLKGLVVNMALIPGYDQGHVAEQIRALVGAGPGDQG